MPSRKLSITAAVLAAAVMLTTSACTKKSAGTDPITASSGVALFGTDGIMLNSFGDAVKVPGQLNGMSGTAPLNPVNASFSKRLLKIDPTLDDYLYAGQAYDAVAITALAAETAHSVSGRNIAKYIDAVTEDHGSAVECTTIASCMSDIDAGHQVAYRGYTITSGLTKAGEPSTASYGTQHFGQQNHIDPQKTEFVTAGDPKTAATDVPAPPAKTGAYTGPALKLGMLLPKTGPLAGGGKAIIAAVKLAIDDLNNDSGGGVLGKKVTYAFADDGTDVNKSVAGAKSLISQGVNAIIGPSFSGAAAAVVPLAVAAGVVEFTPSATSADLSTINDHGMFFRTAPPDNLQAQAIADVIMRSGAQRVFIVARGDSYGTGLEHSVAAALAQDGLPASGLSTAEYSADASVNNSKTFAQIATSIGDFHADSVLLLGYNEIIGVIEAMAADHITFNAT
jgi:ABC-type branched-subunit amino acid transport system substrate-binding protein